MLQKTCFAIISGVRINGVCIFVVEGDESDRARGEGEEQGSKKMTRMTNALVI
jgi:hypothetical protein